MRIVDAHVHLYPEPDLEKECTVSQESVDSLLQALSQKLKQKRIAQAVVYVLDPQVLNKNFKVPDNLLIATTINTKTYQAGG